MSESCDKIVSCRGIEEDLCQKSSAISARLKERLPGPRQCGQHRVHRDRNERSLATRDFLTSCPKCHRSYFLKSLSQCHIWCGIMFEDTLLEWNESVLGPLSPFKVVKVDISNRTCIVTF